MAKYFRQILENHRANPVPGFLDNMVNGGEGDGRLTDDELIATFVLVLIADHETRPT